MKTKAALLVASVLGAVALSFAQQTPAPPAVLGDGAGAKYKRVENMHQTRFIEVFLAGPWRGEDREHGRGLFQHHVHVQGDPPPRKTPPRRRSSRASTSRR